MKPIWFSLCTLFLAASANAQDIAPPVASAAPGQITISGTVPDEATKAGVLAKLRELYGTDKVVDQIAIGQVSVPANWNNYAQKLITPNLKLVSRGQLKIDGNVVSIRGEVANEAQRQQIASDIATKLNPTYTVNNGLRVSASEQGILDKTLANRIIEFDSGQATLTPAGKAILDEMAVPLKNMKTQKVEIIGHTDNQGLRASNQALSKARADEVKNHLSGKGINPDRMTTFGQGSESPVASNNSVEGRSRNRRIEFRIAQ